MMPSCQVIGYFLKNNAMKFRTFLMFACMTIVPMIAMFSHKIPNEMRTACKKIFLAPINYFSDLILHQSVAADTTLELTDFDEAPNMPLLVKGKKPLRKTRRFRYFYWLIDCTTPTTVAGVNYGIKR
jgi:hypothetical protein